MLQRLFDVSVGGPKIVPPFRDAMCLINSNQGDVESRQLTFPTLCLKPLRREGKQLVHSVPGIYQALFNFPAWDRTVDIGGGNSSWIQLIQLILSPRNQRPE